MDKVVATLRTVGVLLGIWVVLAAVGIAMGAIPMDFASLLSGGGTTAEPETDRADAGAGEPDASAEVADASAAEDAGVAEVAVPDAPPAAGPSEDGTGTRFSVCASSAAEPSLAVGELFGGGTPEIVVGCPDGWHVIAIDGRGPMRIARFALGAAPNGQRARTGPVGFGDVDGDAHPDLGLPLSYEAESGATRGGALFWIATSPFGGIREPVTLAPIAAHAVALGAVDSQAGEEVVALNRANALAQLASEAWVFGGGAAPVRTQALPLGVGALDVAITDLDRDRKADVIGLSPGRIDLFFGDGAGAFPRNHTMQLEGAREIALADLDEDGGVDLAVLGNGIQWIRAGGLEGMEPRGLDGVPANLRGLQAVDVNADRHVDLAGWDHPRLFVMRWRAEVAFDPVVGVSLVGGDFGPRRQRLADLDGDGAADDLVLLGTAGEGEPLEILLLRDALDPAEVTPPPEPRDLPDAPLMLRATLAP
ncbi:MAG: FG-GAP repeat domain-containing protein [Sandaracinaceae bacterium]